MLESLISLLEAMGVKHELEKALEFTFVNIPVPDRRTEQMTFVFQKSAYVSHRISKVKEP